MSKVTKDGLGDYVRRFLEKAISIERDNALTIALSGDLGAGKTTFTQCVARELGIKDPVRSPTYVIEQIYKLPQNSQFKRLVHIDAYRLKQDKELEQLGWNDFVVDPETIIVIEWAENVKNVIPSNALWVQLEITGEESRSISYT